MRIFNKAGQTTLAAATLGMMSMAAYAQPATTPNVAEASDYAHPAQVQIQVSDNAAIRDTVDPTPVVATASASGDPTLEEGAVGDVIGTHASAAYTADATPNVTTVSSEAV